MKVLLTSLFLLIGSLSFAQTTYYVNLSGNDNNSGLSETTAWRTITYAASSSSPVSPGDIVHIKAGNYGNEYVIFDTDGTAANPIKFIGYQATPGDNPDLKYEYGDALDATIMPMLDGGDRTSGSGMTMHNRKYIELSNIQIQNYISGLYAWKGMHLKVKNIIAMHFGDINASYSGKGIVFGSQADGNWVEDCVVYNACAEGLSINGDNHIVKNCRVYADDNSTGWQSAMDYYIHVGGNNNLIEDCYVERIGNIQHGGHGIDLKGNCENNIIRNCVAKGMGYNGYELRHRGTKNNIIENCIAIGCGFTIRDGASHNIIRNCKTASANHAILFLDTTEDGNAQYAGKHNRIENCIFENTVLNAINFFLYGSAEVSAVDSNTFVNCVFDGGTYLFNADRENFDNKMTNCIVTNVQNYAGASYLGTPFPIDWDYEDTYFHNNGFTTPSGINVVTADPLFVDEPNDDFHLLAASPCIDAGNNATAPSIDYDGNPRPNNGIVDIGAYEFGVRTISCALSLLMEGPYSKTNFLMNTNLRQSNLLPAGQPYSIAPWNYQGTEGAGWSMSDYPNGTVDWVLVSLRTSPMVEDEVARFAAILLEDGTVYTLNDIPLSPGISQVYVLIEHRNHLPVMSALPIDILSNAITYDFRTQDSYKGAGSGFGQKLVGSNWMMYGGNGDQDGLNSCDINAADRIFWQTVNGLFGVYNPGDYNLDSDINAADRIVFNYNNGIFTTIPKSIDAAPKLTCPASNFVLNNCTYTVNWTHPNPTSTVVNYDLHINGVDPGLSKQYPITSWTIDICTLLGISSGSGALDIELFYWYDGDSSTLTKTDSCTVNYNF